MVTKKYLRSIKLFLTQAELLVFEGTIRSSKTYTAIDAFFYAVNDSNEYLHMIACEDNDAVIDNVLKCEGGLLIKYGEYCKFMNEQIGGWFVAIGTKKVLLCGYRDARKWQKILGKTLGVIYVDEANTANKQFIDECFARQTSCDKPKMIWTLNGDIPTHWIYQDYINRCNIVGTAPASIMADMGKAVKHANWYYIHWNMADNPIMTPEKIERAKAIYPVGSYYYTIKILGERGAPGRLIYNDYMHEDIYDENLSVLDYKYFMLGCDIGATQASNVIVLFGVKADYSGVGIFDPDIFQQAGYEYKTQRLEAYTRLWCKRAPIECIAIDSAEQNFIRDIAFDFKSKGLPPVINSYKATIKERVDMYIILLSQGRVKTNSKDVVNAFRIAKWVNGKEGEEREDLNEVHNDILDAVEYASTRYMKKLMAVRKHEQI